MLHLPENTDWQQLADDQLGMTSTSLSPRHRLRWILVLYGLALATVMGRAVQLELADGEDFRRCVTRPIESTVTLAAPRGRILARDGTVLALDEQASALAVHYSYLQLPPDPRWLRRQARSRLTRSERRDAQRLAQAEAAVCRDLAEFRQRLAALSGIDDEQWNIRAARIQQRVEALADRVNRRRLELHLERTTTIPDHQFLGVTEILSGLFAPPEQLPPAEVIVAEQTAYHRIVDDLRPEAIEAVNDHPDAYPGVKVVTYTRRTYPLHSVASHLVGHVGVTSPARATLIELESHNATREVVGLLGVEREKEQVLSGRLGEAPSCRTEEECCSSCRSALLRSPGTTSC